MAAFEPLNKCWLSHGSATRKKIMIAAKERFEWVCGVDESGRGPLAGPVFAACVILDPDCKIAGLADSKTLGKTRRDQLTIAIKKYAISWTVASASVTEIDRLNILGASMLAMQRAVESLPFKPDRVLVDGNHSPRVRLPVTAIVRGDCLVPAISAASIIAKTARDAEMMALHQRFPHYGFDHHKGYPTEMHLAALHAHGASAIHRRSFAPVRKIIVTLNNQSGG